MRWLNRQDIRPSSCPPTPQTSMPSNTTLPSSKNSGQTHRHTPRLTTLLNHMEIIWHDYNANYGKEEDGDIWEGKRTLMLIRLFREARPDERERLVAFLDLPRQEKSASEVDWVRRLMDPTAALSMHAPSPMALPGPPSTSTRAPMPACLTLVINAFLKGS